jgi:ribosomal protein S18 acetylase RimI-like enzyme
MNAMKAEELFRIRDDGWRYELVRGELRKAPLLGMLAGEAATVILASLVNAQPPGRVCAPCGFVISRNPDTVRVPAGSFIRAERVVRTPFFFDGPPDIAVDIDDGYTVIEEKAADWLSAGTEAVIVIDPERQSVHIHRAGAVLNVTDAIAVDDVIPSWRLPLSELFE